MPGKDLACQVPSPGCAVRRRLDVHGPIPTNHRRFLVSFESGAPDWTLLDVPRADRLPAIKWRQQNLAKLTRNKRIALVAQLEAVLQQPATPSQFTLFAEPGAPNPKRHKR